MSTINREAAIRNLTAIISKQEGKPLIHWEQVKKMLEAMPDVPDTNVGDMISRQAAIDVAVQSIMDWDGMFMQEANCRIRDAINELPSAQPEEVIPHRNYKYLSDYWCACGWHLGKKGDVKYCADCGRKVKWDE